MSRSAPLIAMLAFMLAPSWVAYAQSPTASSYPSTLAATECDRLTASSDKSERVAGVDPVQTDRIDGDRAISVCETDLSAHPGDERLTFELGRTYFSQGRYEMAREKLHQAVILGSPAAMNALGLMALYSFGQQYDSEAAKAFFLKAQKAGSNLAATNLGTMYEYGYGVPVDFQEARKWLQLGDPFTSASNQDPSAKTTEAASDFMTAVRSSCTLPIQQQSDGFFAYGGTFLGSQTVLRDIGEMHFVPADHSKSKDDFTLILAASYSSLSADVEVSGSTIKATCVKGNCVAVSEKSGETVNHISDYEVKFCSPEMALRFSKALSFMIVANGGHASPF